MEISDEDVVQAMAAIPGYIDITTADFKEIYLAAYALALKRMMTSVQAKDIMTHPVTVVQADTPLMETAGLLAEKNISGVPVVDGDQKVIGVVSEKDFIKNMGAGVTGSFMGIIAECLKDKGCVAAPVRVKLARDIMSHPAITAREDISHSEISALFAARRINRLPIVDGKDRLVGIVTRSDLVQSYCFLE
ncbi:MAG: CBS domain-containing protein [Proteobacteria bacterium]|nr:CBS domain-containing protein [Pseudomonadota bacterium]MBU4472379.1 CBS domain-containing protein [Pseudomonadota bacterium]